MFKVLIFSKLFKIGGGGHPQALHAMSHSMKKKIIFDVYHDDGFSINIGSKFNLKNILAKDKKKLKLNSYNAFIICGSWQIKILYFLIIAKLKKRKIIYMPKGNLSLYEFYSYRGLLKLPVLFTVEIIKILLSDLIIYTSELEKKYSFSNSFIFKKYLILPDYYKLVKKKLRSNHKEKKIFNIGFIAQYSKRKSLIECIDSFELLCNSHPKKKFFFFIAGTPVKKNSKYYNDIIKRICLSKYNNKIFILGHLDGLDKRLFYKKMNLILYPSKYESFGLIALEGIEYGCNILTTFFIGALENITSKNIYKIRKINKENITKGIQYFLKNPHYNEFKKTIKKINHLIYSRKDELYKYIINEL